MAFSTTSTSKDEIGEFYFLTVLSFLSSCLSAHYFAFNLDILSFERVGLFFGYSLLASLGVLAWQYYVGKRFRE
jgi:hypothetical protein